MPIDLVHRIAHILRGNRSGLLTDIDGTISEIADRPDEATANPDALRELDRLSRLVAVVGVITGRAVDDARAMVKSDALLYSGNHGLERWRDGKHQIVEGGERFLETLPEVMNRIGQQCAIPGMILEDKGITGSIHYRQAENPESARDSILQAAIPLLDQYNLRLTEGRMVVELRPDIEGNKGISLERVVTDQGLSAVVFLGDDTTDVDAFRAIQSLRERGVARGMSIGVVTPETPHEVIQNADATVEGVDGVVQLLHEVANLLELTSGRGTST